jgi:hypothetical protein
MESNTPEVVVSEQICKSCGNHFTGNYCNLCGEKVLATRDKTFKSFLVSIKQLVSPGNSSLIKSLKYVITSPGFLSKEFAEGKRVNYTQPLQLFFILNLIYFLFPMLQLFNTSLRTQMYLRTHSKLVQEMVQSKLRAEGYSMQSFSLLYNEKSTGHAKLLIIVFVILASLPLSLIYRKRNRYFSDHFTLATELASFNLIMNAIFLSVFLIIINKIFYWTNSGWQRYLDDQTLTIIFILTNLYFLTRAGKIFYNQTGFKLVIKVVLSLLGLFVALEAYRLLLFLVTYWSL